MNLTSAEKSRRYRDKDVEAYRTKKAAYARTPEERAKRTAYQRKWREANRELSNQFARESHHRNKHKHTEALCERRYKKLYGLGLAEYQAMLAEQGGVCGICGKPPMVRKLHIDHDHKSGRIRGLLCPLCNARLGWFEGVGPDKIAAYLAVS